MKEKTLRQEIVAAYKALEAKGLNRASSGNISVRIGDRMLITPSAVSHDALTPDLIASMVIDAEGGEFEGPKNPSSEWRFHRDILRTRPDINSVVHTHAPFSTILSIARKPIPSIHYMMAAFGGTEIPVADYALYGTHELSENIIAALSSSNLACLMANHGMVVGGADLTRAMWLAGELEALAHQYYHVLAIGGGHVLSDEQIAETREGFASYGVQSKEQG